MKNKTLLLLLALCVFTLHVAAQSNSGGLELKVYGGYSLFTPGSDYTYEYSNTAVNNQVTSVKYVDLDYKLGQSPHYGGGVSLPLGKIFTVGLDADYLNGNHKTAYTFENNYAVSVTTKYHVFSVIPNITYKFYSNSRYNIYNTLGFVVAASSKLDLTLVGQGSDKQAYSFGVNAGFKDAMGIKVGVAKHLQVFAEASGFFLGQSATKLVLTEYGPGMSTQTFKRSGNYNYTSTHTLYSDGIESYQTALGNPFHFSSIGLNIGVAYHFK